MKLPPFMLAAAVLFWGWQAGHEALALLLAIVFEVCRTLGYRRHTMQPPGHSGAGAAAQWQFSLRTLGYISNACSWLFVGTAAYFLIGADLTKSILSIIRWVPLTVLPLLLAIQISGLETIRLSTISAIAHKKSQANPAEQTQIDIGIPYVCMWLLAAGVSNHPGPGFYLGLLAMVVWILWAFRPRHGSAGIWLGLMLAVGGAGAVINQGLYHLQGVVEQSMMDFMANDEDENLNQTSTDLGHIGKLKLSGSVVMQVKTEKVLFEPLLLKTASYNTYGAPSWLATGRVPFRTVLHTPQEGEIWRTPWGGTLQASEQALEISATAKRVDTVLALPLGVSELASPQFSRVARNSLGSIRAKLEPGFYWYRVKYADALQNMVSMPEDLRLPRVDRELVQNLAQQLALPGQPPARVLSRLQNWFATDFRYTTTRGGNAKGNTSLADFLTRDRRGHCEHFATATVLLLRAAGIPARYAVGYSVQEPNRFGSGYVVRQRHAHAWTEVYVDGAWQNFDTTPPVWGASEQSRAPFWEPLRDAAVWLSFQVRRLDFSRTEGLLAGAALLALVVLRSLWHDWRAKRQQRQQRKQGERGKAQKTGGREELRGKGAEAASALAQIERVLAARGMGRPVHESLFAWQARIAPQLEAQFGVRASEAGQALAQLIRWHYRCRFGPVPVPQEESARLQEGVRDWIARFGAGG